MNYRVYKRPVMDQVAAEQVVPIQPSPVFRSNTSSVHVVQGGFMDDQHCWHEAPKGIKEAVRLGGTWYWAKKIRDRSGKIILSKSLLFPIL